MELVIFSALGTSELMSTAMDVALRKRDLKEKYALRDRVPLLLVSLVGVVGFSTGGLSGRGGGTSPLLFLFSPRLDLLKINTY